MDIPYAWNIHEVTNVRHVRGVTKIARESAIEQQEFHGADPDIDVIVAATLLHDVGKCYEYVDFVEDEKLLDPDPRYATDEIPHSRRDAHAHELGVRWRSSERFRTLSARFRRGHWRPNSSRARTRRPRTPSRRPRWESAYRSGSKSTPRRSSATAVPTAIVTTAIIPRSPPIVTESQPRCTSKHDVETRPTPGFPYSYFATAAHLDMLSSNFPALGESIFTLFNWYQYLYNR